MQAEEAAKLFERALVVVHAQVVLDAGQPGIAPVALDDEQSGRPLAAAVSSFCLGGIEAVEQALGQRLAGSLLERVCETVDRRARDEMFFALGGVTGARCGCRPSRCTSRP